ncbi:MAG: hypothetical protein AABZ33_01895, partial [Chloroflexota bacterium]
MAVVLAFAMAWPVAAVSGPTKVSDPVATPTAATPATTISFGVTYRNREGSPPDYVRVVIDGVARDMIGSGDTWKAGVRFSFSTQLPIGTHEVAFTAQDRDRFSDTIAGPVVTVVPAPTPAPTPTSTPAPAPTP